MRLPNSQAYFLLFLSVLFAFVIFTRFHQFPDFSDFNVYYTAGQKALNHHTVYDVPHALKFKYAPITALAFGFLASPFAFEKVTWVFYALNLMGWLALVILFSGSFAGAPSELSKKSRLERTSLVLAYFLFFFSVALRDELKLGQINIVPIALLYFFLKSWEQDRPFYQGTLFSLACQFKLYCLIALPLLIIHRRFKILFIALGVYGVLNLGVFAVWNGWALALSETHDWLSTLATSTVDILTSRYSVSILSTFLKLTHLSWLAHGIWVSCGAIFLLLQWRLRNLPGLHQWAFLLLSILLLSPVSWPCWMIFSFPALFYVFSEPQKSHGSVWLKGALTAFIFVNTNNLNSGITYRGLPCLMGLIILGLFLKLYLPAHKKLDLPCQLL